jgi:hypothetical protein
MYYNRRDIKPGETYEMDDREEGEAKILSALGKIEILKQQRVEVETRALQPEQPKQEPLPKPTAVEPLSTESAEALTTPTRRTYRRRDLKAEQ